MFDDDSCVRMLGILREAGRYKQALRIWPQLPQSLNTDSIAIELLAGEARGITVCDEVFAAAIERYKVRDNGPWQFYHWQCSKALIKAVQCSRILTPPQNLLVSAFEAHALYEDWRSPYLILDSALKYWTVSRLHERFLSRLALLRPLHEAFAASTRLLELGAFVKPRTLGILLDHLARAMRAESRIDARMLAFQSMLQAAKAFRGSFGQLDKRHLNCLVRGALLLLPCRRRNESQQMMNIKETLDKSIFALCLRIFRWISGRHMTVEVVTTIVQFARRVESISLLELALEQSKIDQIRPDLALLTEFVAAGGTMGSKDLVRSAWSQICANHMAEVGSLDGQFLPVQLLLQIYKPIMVNKLKSSHRVEGGQIGSISICLGYRD